MPPELFKMRWHYIAFININKAFFILYLLNQNICTYVLKHEYGDGCCGRCSCYCVFSRLFIFLIIKWGCHNMQRVVVCELIFIKKESKKVMHLPITIRHGRGFQFTFLISCFDYLHLIEANFVDYLFSSPFQQTLL